MTNWNLKIEKQLISCNECTQQISNYRREWLNTFIDDVFLIPAQVLYIKQRHKDMIGRKQNEMVKTWLEENKTKWSVFSFYKICFFQFVQFLVRFLEELL